MKNFLLVIGVLIMSCNSESSTSSKQKQSEVGLFELVSPAISGIEFQNSITEDDNINYINFDGIYDGAGSAVVDINNDGLQDVFFVSNQGPDKLFLNKGDLVFEDISAKAGIQGGKEWGSGVTASDVNGDGFMDIYVCCHLLEDEELRKNKLYINNKDNTFTERAKEFGLDDAGYSIHAGFFDYDVDGDLDLFVVNQAPNYLPKRKSLNGLQDYRYTSNLYRNEDQKFVKVTLEAGVQSYAYSLSVSLGDLTNDGLPDIYIANDYEEPDIFYMNQGNGKFGNIAQNSLKHMSNFSMGSDIADINNDGWLDIFTADMVAEDHFRNKTNMSGMNPKKFWDLVNSGYHYQYMFNSLQLNNGNGTFSEIAQLAGVSKTDWSWTSFFSDFDNDGFKDLYITNGILKDVRNKDFEIKRRELMDQYNLNKSKGAKLPSPSELLDFAPSVKIKNYMYRNDGHLHFDNMTDKWNLGQPSFSQGASYADLDNDGDLDLIVNNMSENAFLYKNNSRQISKDNSNYLRIKIDGNNKNINGIGVRAKIYIGDKFQVQEMNNVRGYMSMSEQIFHFGLGESTKIDSIIIRWQSGKTFKMENPKINTLIKVKEEEAKIFNRTQFDNEVDRVYTQEMTNENISTIAHQESKFDDYKTESLMPHRMSTLGPVMEIADVNKDGLDDIFIGGSVGSASRLFMQDDKGNFNLNKSIPLEKYKQSEPIDAVFFDADGDMDLDLYLANGSNEYGSNSKFFLDNLFLNEGNANFIDASSKLDQLSFSKGTVSFGDLDGDNDMDLFIGGRQISGKYGLKCESAILINEKGFFKNRTESWAPQMLKDYGTLTSSLLLDINKDNKLDLIHNGEWEPISILINTGSKLEDRTKDYGLTNTLGWWNKLEAGDLDNDGDIDLIAGNLGLNSKFKATEVKPFKVFLSDFDKNGSWDTYLGSCSNDGNYYPVRGRQCSSEQMPFVKDKFKSYSDFAKQPIEKILDGKLNNASIREVKNFASSILVNNGNTFLVQKLPIEAQFAPIYGIVLYDFNHDNFLDIAYCGNYYNREVETSRSDAGIGGILLNNHKLEFKAVPFNQTGIKANEDAREMKFMRNKLANYLVIANNNKPIQINYINPKS